MASTLHLRKKKSKTEKGLTGDDDDEDSDN